MGKRAFLSRVRRFERISVAERGPGDGASVFQWKPIRFGGKYVRITRPMMLERGTVPQVRESQENARLSPMKKY